MTALAFGFLSIYIACGFCVSSFALLFDRDGKPASQVAWDFGYHFLAWPHVMWRVRRGDS